MGSGKLSGFPALSKQLHRLGRRRHAIEQKCTRPMLHSAAAIDGYYLQLSVAIANPARYGTIAAFYSIVV